MDKLKRRWGVFLKREMEFKTRGLRGYFDFAICM